MERVADLRMDIHDLDQARRIFDDVALLTIALAKKDATFEHRIAKLKAEHDDETCTDRAIMFAGGDLLARFIEQHKDLFADPRKVKTSMGSFGLQAVSELVIENQVRLNATWLKTKSRTVSNWRSERLKPPFESGSKPEKRYPAPGSSPAILQSIRWIRH